MRITILFIIVVILISVSCEKFAHKKYVFSIKNNSKQTISVFGAYQSDTLLPMKEPDLKNIASGKYGDIYDGDVNDEKYERLKTERITLFVLSSDTVKKYSWDSIREDYKILKRYTFNNQELTDMGGSVNYP